MKKYISWSNNFIGIFLTILILISALSGSMLIMPNFEKLSSKSITLLFIATVVFVFLLLVFRKTYNFFKHIYAFIAKNLWAKLIILGFIVIWQFYFVYSISGIAIWDPSGLLNRVVGTPHMIFPAKEYLSVYPNNFLLYLFEKGIWVMTGKTGIPSLSLTLSFINIVLVDVTTVLLGTSVKALFGKLTQLFYYVLAFIFTLSSPWISVPYSDVWGFCLSSLSIFLIIKLYHSTTNGWRNTYAILLGSVIFASYYIKPSLIIFFIAVILILLLATICKKKVLKVSSIFIIAITAFVLSFSFSVFKKNNPILEINSNRTFSLFHFAAMGTTAKGGYYAPDVQIDRSIKNPEKRKQRDINTYKQRLESFKTTGNYLRFLAQKQAYNTGDGTFTWGYSGNKIYYKNIDNFPQRLFSTGRIVHRDSLYTLIVQVIWTVSLFMILFTIPDKRLILQILKYSTVGIFIFLLIFEGGRSRYLIQALPILLLLSSVGMKNLYSDLLLLSEAKHKN